MAIEIRSERLPRKDKRPVIPADLLRISNRGIFLKGEVPFTPPKAYEGMCAKRARDRHPDKFIISPYIIDSMALMGKSIFSRARPDILYLVESSGYSQNTETQTYVWGADECKSGSIGSDNYDLAKKAEGIFRFIKGIEDDPTILDRYLRKTIKDSMNRIPINLTRVLVPERLHVTFVTHEEVDKLPPHPRMIYHYEVEESPFRRNGKAKSMSSFPTSKTLFVSSSA